MFRKVAFGVLGLSTAGVGALVISTEYYKRQVSILFPGEPKSFDIQYDEQFGLPITQIMPILGEGILTPLVLQSRYENMGLGSLATKKAERAFDKLIKEFPECFLGYAGKAWLYSKTDIQKAEEYFEKSLEIAESNPKWTDPLHFLLPSRSNLFDASKIEYPTEFSNVTDNVLLF